MWLRLHWLSLVKVHHTAVVHCKLQTHNTALQLAQRNRSTAAFACMTLHLWTGFCMMPIHVAAVYQFSCCCTSHCIVHRTSHEGETRSHAAQECSTAMLHKNAAPCHKHSTSKPCWVVGLGADLSLALLGELVDQSGAGDCLASAGRALNETERRLQHCLHCIHLHTYKWPWPDP